MAYHEPPVYSYPICSTSKICAEQYWLCPGCHQHLENGEETHIHHVIPKQHGGKEDLVNLRLVHRNCHHQIHSIRAPLGVRRLLEPGAR
jgi:5-methylcytosine-specific restriction endonuclease McrA